MHCSKSRVVLLLCAGLGIGLLFFHELALLPDGHVHVHFFDVGQGDAAFLVSPMGKQVLIDGGPDLSTLEHISTVMPFFDRSIDLLVLTHPHADHLSALPLVLQRYSVGAIVLSGVAYNSGRYQWMLHEIEKRKIPIIIASAAKDIDLGDGVYLDILWPIKSMLGEEMKNLNDSSVAFRALFRNQSILFTGDIEHDAENGILASGAALQANILKVAHHGSRTSSMVEFLQVVDPLFGIISSGKENRFGHPHQDVVDRFESLGIELRSTASRGTISLVF